MKSLNQKDFPDPISRATYFGLSYLAFCVGLD